MNKELKIEQMDNGFLVKVYDGNDGRVPLKKLVASDLPALYQVIASEFSITAPGDTLLKDPI